MSDLIVGQVDDEQRCGDAAAERSRRNVTQRVACHPHLLDPDRRQAVGRQRHDEVLRYVQRAGVDDPVSRRHRITYNPETTWSPIRPVLARRTESRGNTAAIADA